jgi:hypothetical protein
MQRNMMIHGKSMLSLTATATEMLHAMASPDAQAVTVSWLERKKSTLFVHVTKLDMYFLFFSCTLYVKPNSTSLF